MAECRYKGWCRIEYDTDFDVCYPCIGDWGETCDEYEPMPDAESLLALADEIDDVAGFGSFSITVTRRWLGGCADRIRVACGVESEAAERRVEMEEK